MGNYKSKDENKNEQVVIAEVHASTVAVDDKLNKYGIVMLFILGILCLLFICIIMYRCKKNLKGWMDKQVTQIVSRNSQRLSNNSANPAHVVIG